mmetsp:Transcript_78645/g.255311  ORF Transcript_78645/g.255311 Transcript_78645/m.255311 type:complete len:201 (-) Transcript_78645:308-910(-)
MLRGRLRSTSRCLEFVTSCSTRACLIEEQTHCLEDGTLLCVDLSDVGCHGVKQILASRHQSDGAPLENIQLPGGLHVGEEADVQPVLLIEASDGFTVRLKVFELLNKYFFCRLAHSQNFCISTLDAAGPGRGEQGHARDAEDLCRKSSVGVHQGAVQHSARIDRTQPPDGPWQHELIRDHHQLADSGHEAFVLQTVFSFQ